LLLKINYQLLPSGYKKNVKKKKKKKKKKRVWGSSPGCISPFLKAYGVLKNVAFRHIENY